MNVDLHPDFRDLLAEFVRCGVRFVVLGGYAVGHRSAEGIDTELAISRADTVLLDELAIPIIALEDLIANKRATGRARDLADVETLERVRALTEVRRERP